MSFSLAFPFIQLGTHIPAVIHDGMKVYGVVHDIQYCVPHRPLCRSDRNQQRHNTNGYLSMVTRWLPDSSLQYISVYCVWLQF